MLSFFIGVLIGLVILACGGLVLLIIRGSLGVIGRVLEFILDLLLRRKKFKEIDNDEIPLFEMKQEADGYLSSNRNLLEARHIYKKLAGMNYPGAAAALGYVYYEGLGGLKDYKEAAKWFIIAYKNNDTEYPISLKHKRNAITDLAEMYLTGKGVHRDPNKTLMLLNAEKGKYADDLRFKANYAKKP